MTTAMKRKPKIALSPARAVLAEAIQRKAEADAEVGRLTEAARRAHDGVQAAYRQQTRAEGSGDDDDAQALAVAIIEGKKPPKTRDNSASIEKANKRVAVSRSARDLIAAQLDAAKNDAVFAGETVKDRASAVVADEIMGDLRRQRAACVQALHAVDEMAVAIAAAGLSIGRWFTDEPLTTPAAAHDLRAACEALKTDAKATLPSI